MPPAESRVKMNGFAAPDTAAVICSAAIKRGFAAPSPGFPAHNFIFSESNLRKILDSTCRKKDIISKNGSLQDVEQLSPAAKA